MFLFNFLISQWVQNLDAKVPIYLFTQAICVLLRYYYIMFHDILLWFLLFKLNVLHGSLNYISLCHDYSISCTVYKRTFCCQNFLYYNEPARVCNYIKQRARIWYLSIQENQRYFKVIMFCMLTMFNSVKCHVINYSSNS